VECSVRVELCADDAGAAAVEGLKIVRAMPDAPVLTQELLNFQTKITSSMTPAHGEGTQTTWCWLYFTGSESGDQAHNLTVARVPQRLKIRR